MIKKYSNNHRSKVLKSRKTLKTRKSRGKSDKVFDFVLGGSALILAALGLKYILDHRESVVKPKPASVFNRDILGSLGGMRKCKKLDNVYISESIGKYKVCRLNGDLGIEEKYALFHKIEDQSNAYEQEEILKRIGKFGGSDVFEYAEMIMYDGGCYFYFKATTAEAVCSNSKTAYFNYVSSYNFCEKIAKHKYDINSIDSINDRIVKYIYDTQNGKNCALKNSFGAPGGAGVRGGGRGGGRGGRGGGENMGGGNRVESVGGGSGGGKKGKGRPAAGAVQVVNQEKFLEEIKHITSDKIRDVNIDGSEAKKFLDKLHNHCITKNNISHDNIFINIETFSLKFFDFSKAKLYTDKDDDEYKKEVDGDKKKLDEVLNYINSCNKSDQQEQ